MTHQRGASACRCLFGTVLATLAAFALPFLALAGAANAQQFAPHWRYTVVDSAFDGVKPLLIHRRGASFDDPSAITILEAACTAPYNTATVSLLLDTSGAAPGQKSQVYLYGDNGFNMQPWGEITGPGPDNYQRAWMEIPLESPIFQQIQTGGSLGFSLPGRQGNTAFIAMPQARDAAAQFVAKCRELAAGHANRQVSQSDDFRQAALDLANSPGAWVASPLQGTWRQSATTGGPGCRDCKLVAYGTTDAVLAVTTDCVVFRGTYLDASKTMAAGLATMSNRHPLSGQTFFTAMLRKTGQGVELSLAPDDARSQQRLLHSPVTISYGLVDPAPDAGHALMIGSSCPSPAYFAGSNANVVLR